MYTFCNKAYYHKYTNKRYLQNNFRKYIYIYFAMPFLLYGAIHKLTLFFFFKRCKWLKIIYLLKTFSYNFRLVYLTSQSFTFNYLFMFLFIYSIYLQEIQVNTNIFIFAFALFHRAEQLFLTKIKKTVMCLALKPKPFSKSTSLFLRFLEFIGSIQYIQYVLWFSVRVLYKMNFKIQT